MPGNRKGSITHRVYLVYSHPKDYLIKAHCEVIFLYTKAYRTNEASVFTCSGFSQKGPICKLRCRLEHEQMLFKQHVLLSSAMTKRKEVNVKSSQLAGLFHINSTYKVLVMSKQEMDQSGHTVPGLDAPPPPPPGCW